VTRGDADTDAARRLLGGIVSDDVLTAYERLLDAGGCRVDAAVEVIGDPALVAEITRVGMAQTAPDPSTRGKRLVPVAPDHALEGVLLGLQAELRQQHEKLLGGYQRLNSIAGKPTGLRDFANEYIEVIVDREEITRTSTGLMNTAHADWMSLENGGLETGTYDTGGEPPLPVFAGEVRSRSIYETAFMDSAAGRKLIHECMDAGEESRLLPKIHMKLKLADDRAALLPLTTTGMGGALLIRSWVIVKGIREYFELLWERAIPVGSKKTYTDTPLSKVDFDILRLMAEGQLDADIARRLNMSVPTVRRHIDGIRAELGAPNRFVAGVAARRRGWVD
jgi:DNA-binding CsgD family transcriptional regulator